MPVVDRLTALATGLVTTLTTPLRAVVATVLVAAHDALAALGLAPAGGAAWALAIVALVLAVRVALLPLTVWQVRGARATAAAQPRLREVQARHRGRTDTASLLEARAARQQVLREAGARPLLGCLPVLAQGPVLLALYAVLAGLAAGTTAGPLDDGLVAQAAAAHVLGAPLAGTLTAALGGSWLAPAVVVPATLLAVMVAGQVLTQRLAARQRVVVGDEDPLVRRTTALLAVVPAVVALTGAHLPVGVLLYWATSALWSLAQQAVVVRWAPHPGSPAHAARERRRAVRRERRAVRQR